MMDYRENSYCNYVHILIILIIWSLLSTEAKLKNGVYIVHSLLKACDILESGKEVQMRWMKWSATSKCKLWFARNPFDLFLPNEPCYQY